MTRHENLTPPLEYRSEHHPGLLALSRRNFGAWSTDRLEQRWQWQYGAGNPWRSLRPAAGLVVLDGDALVAGVALFPIPWRIGSARRIVLCVGDFAIDREYRVRVVPQLVHGFMSRPPVVANGLHPTLWKTMLRKGAVLLPMSRVRFAMRLRNRGLISRALRRRLPPAARRFVSPETVGALLARRPVEAILRRIARGGGGPPRRRTLPAGSPRADVRPFERFGDEYDRLWEQARSGLRMTLDKDSRYLNWRYLECPIFHSPILRALFRNDKLAGVVVAGACTVLDENREPCGVDGEILDLITVDATAEETDALLLAVCHELDRRGVDRIGAISCGTTVRSSLRRIGFQPEEDQRFDTMLVLDPPHRNTGRVDSTEGVYIAAGDGDVLNAVLM